MDEYREVTGTIEVPANTGLEGFVKTIRELLRRPRLQEINIDARGKVTFRRFAKNGEEHEQGNNFGVDLSDLQPWHVIRNAEIKECLPPQDLPAAVIVGIMFDQVAKDRLIPLVFATGRMTVFWDWYQFTTGYTFETRDRLFGLPVLTDRQLPDTALLLCAGFGRDAKFIDTQVSYKVEMPRYELSTEAEVPT
jgi:hypothetical protein